jgi:AraC-like DNA-binding protein
MVFVFVLAVSIGLFLNWSVLFIRSSDLKSKLISFFAIAFSANLITDCVQSSIEFSSHPIAIFFILLDNLSLLCSFILFYLHAKLFCGKQIRVAEVWFLSIVALALSVTSPEIYFPNLLDIGIPSESLEWDDLPQNNSFPAVVYYVEFYRSVGIKLFSSYLVLSCFLLLFTFKNRIPYYDKKIVNKLLILCATAVVLQLSWIATYVIVLFDVNNNLVSMFIISIGYVAFAYSFSQYLLSYYGVPHDNKNTSLVMNPSSPGFEIKEKYRKSQLTQSGADSLAERIVEYLQQSRHYANPELGLQTISEALSVSPHMVSQAINQSLHLNYYDLINKFRVEEACRILRNPKNKYISIMEVALLAGFSSKSSFYSVFKKLTGVTPLLYQQSADNDRF